ncbi:hypothetical protein [Salipiger sp. PrR003]|uniref:hypothetical protein n=1 Tax=Salipiger sp. PrR003 TaxID=2706776 RepID=UPI0013DA6AD1|nr:hypothetical protein [Salipiger sp. PrR003]NDV50379.1 hypothetical protein [Salipiger sp. PrR003]
MDAFDFIVGGNPKVVLGLLSRAQCSSCNGTGERDDAAPGDMSFNSWPCQDCAGQGWNKKAVQEIIAAVET